MFAGVRSNMAAGRGDDACGAPTDGFAGCGADARRGDLRVIQDSAATGPVNMARDEALLILAGRGGFGPTLRLYEWSEPTISLGYFQRHADYLKLPPPAGGLPVVRRLTGGGAILHDRELTYSMMLPANHASIARRPTRMYEIVHEALIRCLSASGIASAFCGDDDGSGPGRGPFFCFARRHPLDVVIGTEKVAGSAQRRTRQAVLQHGSIIIARRFEQQPSAALLQWGMDVDDLRQALPHAIAELLGAEIQTAGWTESEAVTFNEPVGRYSSTAWTLRR